MRYHINVYHTKGPLKGDVKAVRYFYNEETARRFYRRLYRHELLGLNPTFWVETEEGVHVRISDFVALAFDEFLLVWDKEGCEADVLSVFKYTVLNTLNPGRYSNLGSAPID